MAILLAATLSGVPSPSPAGGYLVQPGDVLHVSVWKEPELDREVLVRPDGGFSFPLASEVQAAGRTVAMLERELTRRLGRYIPDPVVTVEVRQVLGNKVYVIGRVNRPGEFVVNPPVDVVQALSMAGGLTPYAAVGKILVLRRGPGGTEAIPFDYSLIEKGEGLEQNIKLHSGDVVVVP